MKHIHKFENFLNEESKAWKSFNQAPGKNFMADVEQEKATFNWVASIADAAVNSLSQIKRLVVDLGYDDPRAYNDTDMGFEIRKTADGPFGYRGYIYIDLQVNEIDYKKIASNPDFKKYFSSIEKTTYAEQPTNRKFATVVAMNPIPLPR